MRFFTVLMEWKIPQRCRNEESWGLFSRHLYSVRIYFGGDDKHVGKRKGLHKTISEGALRFFYILISLQVLFHILGILLYNTGCPAGVVQCNHIGDRSILLLALRLVLLSFLFLDLFLQVDLSFYHLYRFLSHGFTTTLCHDLCRGHESPYCDLSSLQERIGACMGRIHTLEQVLMAREGSLSQGHSLKEVLHKIPYLFLLEDPFLSVQFHQILALYHLFFKRFPFEIVVNVVHERHGNASVFFLFSFQNKWIL